MQIIKKDPHTTGKLQFGTEVVSSADGSLSAVLDVSPGASTSPDIMLQVLEQCFTEAMVSSEWKTRLGEMVPSYKINLVDNTAAYDEFASKADALLRL